VEALVQLVGTLPADFPHPVVVVLHVSPTGTSVLPAILARAGRVPVRAPGDGDRMQPGRVYVAPPDSHLIVEDSRLRLSQAPRENGHRPAIDATMRSAAQAYGRRAVGIVLSGSRDDGTAGLMAIKAAGGLTIVQDPDEAMYDAMPRSAQRHVEVDAVLRIAGMAPWILDREAGGRPGSAGTAIPLEPPGARPSVESATGNGTRFTCPDCGGALFERHENGLARFECSIGHVFSMESLSSMQGEALENALWAAVRSLEDRAALLHRMSHYARRSEQPRSAKAFETQADQALERAGTIREAVEHIFAAGLGAAHS
jgi:two-component system chemotaxis response regulator CheB